MVTIIIALLALLLTVYQAYLQRTHNEKSIKPIGQIDVGDRKNQIFVYLQNNGVGPMIIDKLTFTKNNKQYDAIQDCLNLDPKTYWHILITDTVKKVVLSNSHLVVFEKNIENLSTEEIESIKQQLSSLKLTVNYRDIYDNKFSFERKLDWFSRHVKNKEIPVDSL